MLLVFKRIGNRLSTEQQTIFRSHAWIITSMENTFPKNVIERLVLSLLQFCDAIAALH